jgi:hypothetical protein
MLTGNQAPAGHGWWRDPARTGTGEIEQLDGGHKAMHVGRLVSLTVLGVVAVTLLAAASASAASRNPLFTPVSQQTVRGEGGAITLSAGALVIACESNHVISGNVNNSLLIGGIVLHYLGCKYTKGEHESGCPANSTNTTGEGLILTDTLHAILGILLPSSETGILFLPQTSGSFFTLPPAQKNGESCGPAASVSGSIAASITPIEKSQVNGTVKVTHKEIQEVDLTHGLGPVKAKLIWFFGEAAILEQTDSIVFGVATEVT